MDKSSESIAKGGKKKKKSSNRIQSQMEFYFSDSNLRRRDKFLREKISNAVPRTVKVDVTGVPAVTKIGIELAIFMSFNQIKAMTSSESEIRDSLSSSQLLEVFQAAETEEWYVARRDWDGMVEMSQFFQDLDANNEDFDKRTIYCENLPIHANQEWLRKIFSQFGKINLVSVPTFKGQKRIKQFCFVEFGSEEGMKNVLAFFKPFNGVLCYDDTDSNNLQSIKKFHEEEHELNRGKEETGEDSATAAPGNEPSKVTATETTTTPPKKKKNRRKNKSNKDKEEVAEDQEDDEDKSVIEETPKKNYPELNDNMIYDLKIMPKVEWKRLRNKYLNLQREMVRELKKQAYFRKISQNNELRQRPANHFGNPNEPPPNKKIRFDDNNAEESPEDEAPQANDATSLGKSKRRKRGREKIKEKLKKGSHIFFEAE